MSEQSISIKTSLIQNEENVTLVLSDESEDKVIENKYNKTFIMYAIFHLLVYPISEVTYMQWLNTQIPYPWIAAVFFLPIANLIFLGTIALSYYYLNNSNFGSTNISHINIFCIALMNLTSSFIYVSIVPYISILMNNILSRAGLLFLMIMSYIYLKRRYYYTHILGVVIIFTGIILHVSNNIQNTSNSQIYGILLFLLATLIANFNKVYKEKYIKNIKDLNIFWLYACVSIWQLFIGFIAIPFVFIPNTKYYIKYEEFGKYLSDSLQCQYLGVNNENNNQCEYSLMWLFINEFICCFLVLFEYNIVKLGSNVILNIVHVFTIPITILISYLCIKYDFLYFSASEKFTFNWNGILSIFLVIFGSVLYFIRSEYTDKKALIIKNEVYTQIDSNA
jgi:hypothetical protein